jgi:hypothetical protein
MNKATQSVQKQRSSPIANDDQRQLGFCGNGKEAIGYVAIETGGPRRGEWFWAMSQDAPYIDMRWERHGYEATEEEAKARVVEAYEELLRRSKAAMKDRE